MNIFKPGVFNGYIFEVIVRIPRLFMALSVTIRSDGDMPSRNIIISQGSGLYPATGMANGKKPDAIFDPSPAKHPDMVSCYRSGKGD